MRLKLTAYPDPLAEHPRPLIEAMPDVACFNRAGR
jgi:hypothetical protein